VFFQGTGYLFPTAWAPNPARNAIVYRSHLTSATTSASQHGEQEQGKVDAGEEDERRRLTASSGDPAGALADAVAPAERQRAEWFTSDGFENGRPSWSPDGTQIVFQRTSTAPFEWNLWAIGIDGTGLRRVTSGGNDLGPDWGSSVVVPEPSPPEAPTIEIYSPADGCSYVPGMDISAFYTCSSGVSYIVSCEGDVALGAQVELSPAGTHTFTVRAVDADGRTAMQSVTYEVFDIVPPQIDLRAPKDGLTSVDNAGNFSQATSTYTVLDRRPPMIVIASPGEHATYALGSTLFWPPTRAGAHQAPAS